MTHEQYVDEWQNLLNCEKNSTFCTIITTPTTVTQKINLAEGAEAP